MAYQISTKHFDFNHSVFTAHASDLGDHLKEMLGQLFFDLVEVDDNIGFVLTSDKMNIFVPMILHESEVNLNGDVEHWQFRPYHTNKEFDCLIVFNNA